ncbi:hypothetical protein HY995_01400 [Candidatus Micrarchaeota archaeon]|nr:hypothetical protein [Candidatus Micrarchaeota archaeon]MBI5176723.1 hypothetical protein [Candidatus Micrarchaeota archaeon]
MANVTLFISDDLKSRMDKHREMRWSSAIRTLIERKLDDLEEANRLAKKSRLTVRDVDELAASVNRSLAKRAEALLNEVGS